MENDVPQNLTTNSKKQQLLSFLSQKKVFIPAGAIILIIIVVVILFSFSHSKNPATSYQYHPLNGSILLEPATITTTPGKATSAAIMINTGGNFINGVEVAIEYNPKVIENVSLEPFRDPHSAIANSLEPMGPPTDDKNGKIVMTFRLPSTIPSQPGVGQIGRLTFTPKVIDVAVNSTDIKISPASVFFADNNAKPINTNRNLLHVNFATQAR